MKHRPRQRVRGNNFGSIKRTQTNRTCQKTQCAYLRVLAQYISANTSLSMTLSFRWEYKPGSERFVVYTGET